MSETINIAICFSEIDHSEAIGQQIKDILPNINLIISESFEDYLITFSNMDNINCFIIEKDYVSCSSAELIDKIRKSAKYKNSGIILFSPEKSEVGEEYSNLEIDYIFDHSTSVSALRSKVKEIISKI